MNITSSRMGSKLLPIALLLLLGTVVTSVGQFGSQRSRGTPKLPRANQWGWYEAAHAPVEGKVIAVDRTANTITLSASATGETKTYGVTSYTKFSVKGEEASMAEIAPSQTVGFILMSNKKDLSVVRTGEPKARKKGKDKKQEKKSSLPF